MHRIGHKAGLPVMPALRLNMEQPTYKIKGSILTAIALFVVDSFVMNQGIAVIALFVILFWLLPKSAILKYKKQSPKTSLIKAGIYGLMALAIFSTIYANNKIAKHRANNLINVIEHYHQSTGQYPQTLNELVPAYLPKVPRAKFTLVFGDFYYHNYKGDASLMYIALTPLGRPRYDFSSKAWGNID